jgi:hypothetical protein
MMNLFGRLQYSSPGLGVTFIGAPTEMSLEASATKEEASGFPFGAVGTLQTLDSAAGKTSWVLSMKQSSIDTTALEFILNQKRQAIASMVVPTSQDYVVTTGATLTVTGLTADQPVNITVLTDSGNSFLKQVIGSATPAAGEFKVTANTITFHTSLATGSVLGLYYTETKTNLQAIGGSAPIAQFGNMSCTFVIGGTRMDNQRFWMPRVAHDGNIKIGLGVSGEQEIKFDCSVPTGFNLPYMVYPA